MPPTLRCTRRRVVAAAATLVVVAGVCLATFTFTSAAADPLDACTSTHGAIVAVDFGHWGGPVERGCDANPTTGMALLTNGGFTTAGTDHDGPGFVCRIGSTSFDDGTQYPTPADDTCVNTPPASAYWSYWLAVPGAVTWTYSPFGVLSDVPVDGEVEAWTFGATDIGGTTGQPDFTPDSVRAGGGASPSPSDSVAPTPTPSAPAASPADLKAATSYVVGQLAGGDHVPGSDPGTADFTSTAQAGFALAATGDDDATLAKIVTYLQANTSAAIYINGAGNPPDPGVTANIALLVEITGGDPTHFGGQNLLADLSGNICTAQGSLGNCDAAGDFYGAFSPFAQATGILALARGGVTVPASAVTRLTEMQCGNGGFPGSMVLPGDNCDSENDITGFAIQALTSVGGQTSVIGKAGAALLAAQQSDGGFWPYDGAGSADTISTSWDAEALGLLGDTDAMTGAMNFVVGQQENDGGFEYMDTYGSDPYTTADAIPAAAGTNLVTLSHHLTGGGSTPSPTPTPTPTASPSVTGPNLVKGSAYLVTPANLVDGRYYESFPGFADFGLTIDGAFALAASGDQNAALTKIVTFLADAGTDPNASSVDTWTGIGTPFASGGALGKEALLVEVVGQDPHHFGGHDLIAALDASVCPAASTGGNTSCIAAGNYTYSTSTFSQALGIMAQMRAGDAANATAPIAYLESLQHPGGGWPSLIPDSGDNDVDSTAMAAMALALVPGDNAAADVKAGIAFIAAHQEKDGGFPGASGDSVNSAALAVQGLTLDQDHYQLQVNKALGFLAGQQNSDGGFNVAAGGQQGSDIRASTQAVGGAVGTSFGTLHIDLSGTPTPTPTPSKTPSPKPTTTPKPAPTVTVTQTHTTTSTATATATATATVTAVPQATPLSATTTDQPPIAAPTPSTSRTPADASNHSNAPVDLWWIVLAVAVIAAIVIGVLYWRRRRLYPISTGGRHVGGPTDPAGS